MYIIDILNSFYWAFSQFYIKLLTWKFVVQYENVFNIYNDSKSKISHQRDYVTVEMLWAIRRDVTPR